MRLAILALAGAAILLGGAAHATECPPGQVLRNGECVVVHRYHQHVIRRAAPAGPVSSPTTGAGSGTTGGSSIGAVPYYGGYHGYQDGSGPSPSPPSPSPAPESRPILHPDIRETGYAALFKVGSETPGYGLYSYAILSFKSDKSAALLAEITKSTRAVSQLSIDKKNTNVLYVPVTNGMQDALTRAIHDNRNDFKKLGKQIDDDLYDFSMASQILIHVCANPPHDMQALCHADTDSGGPYIFTYTAPATSLDDYPPPYVFVDFTRVPEGAFPEWLSAYRAQVKQKDIHDGTWVNTFRLKVLNYAMEASRLIAPVEGDVRDTINSYIHVHD